MYFVALIITANMNNNIKLNWTILLFGIIERVQKQIACVRICIVCVCVRVHV